MKVRSAAGRVLALLGASATVGVGIGGCVPLNDDINRVQPGYVRKAIFQTNHEWYYRRTIARSEVTNSDIIEGHGDIALERVKFEIQENLLIAYQPYENLPGSNLANLDGNTFFKGPALAMWPITRHFDIIRNYDPLTGNDTNVIVENTEDRSWNEREFMRVDWNQNLVEGSIFADYSGYWFPISLVSTGDYWVSLEEAPTDPYASRFSEDYVEVTTHAFLGMDIFMCAAMTGFSWAGFGNCGFGEAKVRHAFMRVNEPSDYVPRDYPDSVVRKGADGKPIYDPDTGEVVREPFYNRFGIFRLETPTYDRGYGYTESGRLFRAMLFDIWERHTDASGRVLPPAARAEKPIIYYLNAEYPERYRQIAREVAADYNRIFTTMVADLKGTPIAADRVAELCGQPGQVKCMFEIRDNTCNEANIVRFVADNPDLLYAVERAVCTEGRACDLQASDVADAIGIGNLETVCTSLEAATLDPTTGRSGFEWQRIGDPRYNMVVYLNSPQFSPWGGYGPMHADARTGRTVAGTSFLRGFTYEVGAADVVDYLEVMNDEKSIDEVIYGQDVRRHVRETLERRNAFAGTRASPDFLERLDSRMDGLGSTKSELLREVKNTRHQLDRLARVRGTRLEDKVVSEEDIILASEGKGRWRELVSATPADQERWAQKQEIQERASPLGRLTKMNPVSPQRRAAAAALGRAGYCFLNADLDPHWAGLALALREADRTERYRVVASRLMKHVMLHELGHNVGLAHNFEGSYDAMNYNERFWRLEDATAEEKVAEQQDSYRHTTVMEYMSNKGLFADFLGKYDEAAIRFAYANQVQVFEGPNVNSTLQGGETLRSWRYMNDYRDIPDHLCGGSGCRDANQRMAVLAERRWVAFDPQNPPPNEVPYLFCDNAYDRMTPFCATFDYGSNLREIFANYYEMWSSYFFFNNFARERLSPISWNPNAALLPARLAMNLLDTTAQYFYFFNATQGQAFRQTDLHEDMATTLAHGLNMAAEIMSTPEPERMCPWPNSNPKVYIPWFFNPSVCDQWARLDSAYARDAEMIELPLGDARPSGIGFTSDYEDYQLRYIGSYFDKQNVVFSLGLSNPRLFRFNYDIDLRNYFISLYRLFEPELNTFYDDIVNLDNFLLRQRTATTLGSFWCRDPARPQEAHLGYFEPKKMIDPVTNASLPGPSASCTQPAYVYPSLLANTPYSAMLAAHALFSSEFDSQLDMGKDLKIYVLGSDDDFPAWRNFPRCEAAPTEDCFCSITDSLTGLEYRAVQFAQARFPGEPVAQSAACRIIDFATQAQNRYASSRDPRDKDNWRQWIERLEYARDLYRVFQSR